MRTTAKSSSSSPAPRRQPADPVLERVKGPEDLAGLDTAELAALAAEIRGFLIEKVCAAGGHLGVNLGVVELTIALHRAFRSPHDVLLFDTGHQSYVHKILTGRGAGFDVLRRNGGLSGYPSRSESRARLDRELARLDRAELRRRPGQGVPAARRALPTAPATRRGGMSSR